MKTWMKVGLGCLAISVIGVFLVVAGVVGLGYWAKGKVEEVTGGGPAVEEARKAANAAPFTRPAGNVIPEARLVRFIEVRSRVFSVYEKYRGEIESRIARVKDKNAVDFGDISTGLTLMGEIQRAEITALAEEGMSEAEYEFITGEVYKALWSDSGAAETSRKAIQEAAGAARAAAETMKEMRRNGDPSLPPEAREAIARAGEGISAAQDATGHIEDIATAPENQILFKKYETELRKYAMPGLSMFFGDEEKPSASPTPPASR